MRTASCTSLTVARTPLAVKQLLAQGLLMAALQPSVHTRRQQRPVYIPAVVLYVPLGCFKGLAEPAHNSRQEIQVVKDHNSPGCMIYLYIIVLARPCLLPADR